MSRKLPKKKLKKKKPSSGTKKEVSFFIKFMSLDSNNPEAVSDIVSEFPEYFDSK
ncbi:MAG: hypothetical protein JKY50_19420 [Oleispira sp.]|nr:hypothetical protein [Oleispira sp.]